MATDDGSLVSYSQLLSFPKSWSDKRRGERSFGGLKLLRFRFSTKQLSEDNEMGSIMPEEIYRQHGGLAVLQPLLDISPLALDAAR